MPAVKGGNYGGVPAEERQDARRRQLMAAGLEVIGTEGLSAATVRAVCREAGLTTRFFYESFASIEELAVALIDEIFDQTTAAVVEAVAGTTPKERNRVAIETFVRELTEDPRVARFTLMESLSSDALTQRRLDMVRSSAGALVQAKGPRRTPGRSDTYREVVATVLVGGLVELLVAWMRGGFVADLSQIIEDYVQLAANVGKEAL